MRALGLAPKFRGTGEAQKFPCGDIDGVRAWACRTPARGEEWCSSLRVESYGCCSFSSSSSRYIFRVGEAQTKWLGAELFLELSEESNKCAVIRRLRHQIIIHAPAYLTHKVTGNDRTYAATRQPARGMSKQKSRSPRRAVVTVTALRVNL